jgi:hypothetical protein
LAHGFRGFSLWLLGPVGVGLCLQYRMEAAHGRGRAIHLMVARKQKDRQEGAKIPISPLRAHT